MSGPVLEQWPVIVPQPLPTVSGTEAEVCADIAQRQQVGINKYGTTVADNPLAVAEWMQHLYEEMLDACVYVKRAMNELKRK